MRVLIRSSRLTDVRRSALVALVGDLAGVEVSDTAAPLPDPAGFDGVVVDGPQPHSDAAALVAWVGRGGLLVALGAAPTSPGPWADLVGAVAEPALARGEWFGKNVAAASPLTARLDPEFPVVDRFEPLRPLGAAETIVAVSIRFADHAAIVRQPVGDGWVLTSGLGSTNEALACAPLAAIVRRALRAEPARETRSIGIGIVGYGPFGGMGYYHGLGARSTPGLELVAASDPSDERRKAAETDFAGVSTYASADDLAGDVDVDVVFIATPPAYHADLAMRMLRAGKHVACEKPLCLTAAEADALIATAAEHDRVLTVHQNRRWDVDFLAVRRAVDAGTLGEVFNVETFVGGYEHPCRAWHSEVSVSGGAVYDWGSHHIDWILQLLGSPPAVVQTHGHKRVWHDVTNLDQLRVRLTWADGREAEFFQSDVAAVRRPKFYVQGTTGTLVGHYRPVTFERIEAGRGYVAETAHHAEAPAELHLASYESGYGVSETRLALAPEQRFAFHRNLADHLLLGEPLAVTPASVRDVIAVLEAAQRSSDEGNVAVALP